MQTLSKINAEIVADSINEQGHRITSYVLTFPRIILAELNTHRMFSRNSASSRAVPFNKMVEQVQKDPFVPIAWQRDHKGMQGTEYVTNKEALMYCREHWLKARDHAIQRAKNLNADGKGVTKQLCNRLLEPFMWHTALVTATEYENFFKLRCPQYGNKERGYYRSKKDALAGLQAKGTDISKLLKSTDLEWLKVNKGQGEIHIMALAEAMWDAMNESTPKKLKPGEWHIPFGDRFDEKRLEKVNEYVENIEGSKLPLEQLKVRIATARCARVSYINYEGKDDYAADLDLHARLSKAGHWSPFEHCARAMTESEYKYYYRGQLEDIGADEHIYKDGDRSEEVIIFKNEIGWLGNLRGYIQYRKTFKGEDGLTKH